MRKRHRNCPQKLHSAHKAQSAHTAKKVYGKEIESRQKVCRKSVPKVFRKQAKSAQKLYRK